MFDKNKDEYAIGSKAHIVSPRTGKWIYGTLNKVMKNGKLKEIYFISDNYEHFDNITEYVEETAFPINDHNKLKELYPEALYKKGEFE